ncbi:alpha/beta hydrolase [Enterococcus ratti]|nr:alpha/beta hydrolase [Enterococcus ratti]
MKWLKRVMIGLPLTILLLIGIIWGMNQLTPKPVSLLVKRQFDTSGNEQVYPRPSDFSDKIEKIKVIENDKYPSAYNQNAIDIYLPKTQESPLPILFWIHGGAYVAGDKRDCQDYLKLLCADTQQIVININYELAPEVKHPTPLKQLNEVVRWMKEKYGPSVDWMKVSLGGDSAGAQIASEYIIASQNSQIQQAIQVEPSLKNDQIIKFISLSGLLDPANFTQVSDNISSFLYAKCGWAYFDNKKFEQSEEVKQLALTKNTNNWTQKVFLTDGNTNTFTKQMNQVEKALEQKGIKVTKVSYDQKIAVLNHEYQFDFSNKQAQNTYQQLVTFMKE